MATSAQCWGRRVSRVWSGCWPPALYFMHYNYARPHKSLSQPYPTTPAMAAGVADHVWELGEIVALVDSN